ncbi:hypothetical protein BAE44_0021704 [Dichanthelium oligosanthes]|uniref:Zinc finger GRF-type domain-containing protein n=1 Tax=Dichanthelium oligosanthes TaxID=888268 RepID=A0A1E5UWJ9_9POAL|nr:hypothetical protein BAE44_0021704 [Dichanthelium oligosanthes]
MSSSSTSRGTWYGESAYRKSPIPYRVGPLDYEPAVMCKCGKKATLWISWSDDNLGRRYLKCYNARVGGFRFVDLGPVDVFIHGLLVDLHDVVWSLKREGPELKAALADALMKLEGDKLGPPTVMKQKSEKKRIWLFGLCIICRSSGVYAFQLEWCVSV